MRMPASTPTLLKSDSISIFLDKHWSLLGMKYPVAFRQVKFSWLEVSSFLHVVVLVRVKHFMIRMCCNHDESVLIQFCEFPICVSGVATVSWVYPSCPHGAGFARRRWGHARRRRR